MFRNRFIFTIKHERNIIRKHAHRKITSGALKNIIPTYTPYIKMKLGTIGLIPYVKLGTQLLFDLFAKHVNESDGYILQNHGPIVGDKDLMSAFYSLEELEESARIAWELRNEDAIRIG